MQVKITDVETGEELERGQIGILNLKSPRIGPDFIKTTDLASFDTDDFLWIHGRADKAINRGGFKILPEKVAETLRLHDAVREAGILARSEESRVGKAWVSTCRSRWSTSHYKKHTRTRDDIRFTTRQPTKTRT